jgi:hypothetical protein
MSNLPAIREVVRQILRDEFVEGVTPDFEDDEISVVIGETVKEVSQASPREVKESLTAVASKDQDISAVEDLIEVLRAEYPIGGDPKTLLNINRFGNEITLDSNTTPTAGATIYLYCKKYHILGDTSTLNPEEERVLVDGVVAKLAANWSAKLRGQISAAISAIDNINSAIDASTAYLASALTDIDSGRSELIKVGTILLEASTAIGNIATQYDAATADLASARTFINTITVGEDPVTRYNNVATSGVAVANGKVNEVYARLREAAANESLTSEYGVIASRLMNEANISLAMSQGYGRELQARLQIGYSINSYMTQARERLALYRQELREIAKPNARNTMYAR